MENNNLDIFNPNLPSNMAGNIFGLPTTEENSNLLILPIPWEVTTSYIATTAKSSKHVLSASKQVDLYDKEYPKQWKKGYYMIPLDKNILRTNDILRKKAELYLNFLATEGSPNNINDDFIYNIYKEVNEGNFFLKNWVYTSCQKYLNEGKFIAVIGGDHSTPLGYIEALSERHQEFAVLHIDAHFDLRANFEGFEYSHASVIYNIMETIPEVKKIVSIGIRDYCDEERIYVQNSAGKIIPFLDTDIKYRLYEGESWKTICEEIISCLPQKIYISFDIDGLSPYLCPNTGTPVPGGFELEQMVYLFNLIVKKDIKIIGFDISEIGYDETNEWDGNVAARLLYKLCNICAYQNIP
ncbi:MAG: agmatinase family protein [Chitinophagaceae bacterium]